MSRRFWNLLIIVVLVATLTSSIFTVREGKQALLFQFGVLKQSHAGKPVVLMPGLHIKLPFMERAHQFDMRVQSLSLNVAADDANTGLAGTAEYVVNWKIQDLPLFYQRTAGDWQQANTLLSQTLRGHLELAPEKYKDELANQQAATLGEPLGIRILSVQYKGLALTQEALKLVYKNMADAQEQEAKQWRVNGQLQADKILNDAQTQSEIILLQAQADASKERADGDAAAAKIYSDAYNHDPELYAFLISLRAYAKTFTNKQDMIILSPSMQFFNYFNKPQPATASATGQ